MVHKIINNIAPSYFNALLSRVNEQPVINIVLWILQYVILKTMYGRGPFRYSGAQVWNKLPLDNKGVI